MYYSYLCDREFKDSSEVARIFRVLRRRSWIEILRCLDAIAYSKVGKVDYHDGWIKIGQSKIAAKTGFTQTYISTQVLELVAVGLIETKRSDFDCYYYRFTTLARTIFKSIANVSQEVFTGVEKLARTGLYQLVSVFGDFVSAPADQIAKYWAYVRSAIDGNKTSEANKTSTPVSVTLNSIPVATLFPLPFSTLPLKNLIPPIKNCIPPYAIFNTNKILYQDPYQETSRSTQILTRKCDKSEVVDVSPIDFNSEPEPCQTERIDPVAVKENMSTTNNFLEEKDSSGKITIISSESHQSDCDLSAVAGFDRRVRTYQNVNELTAQLVETYNRIKPEHWGKCTSIGFHLPRQAAALLRRYEDADLLIQEWGEACLAVKSNDFYNSPKFKSGNINFLLDASKVDRLPQLAQAWRDRPDQQKHQLAKKMVADANGIPEWGNPDVILRGPNLYLKERAYKRYVDGGNFDHPDCPPIEYLQTYFPHLLTKNV
jgi:DNA-binding MarR family transcriptional regulator